MRTTAAPVGVEGRRHLSNLQLSNCRLDDHFARKLHAGGLKIQVKDGATFETSQTAMEIAARATKEQSANPRQQRIADVAVEKRHRAWANPTAEPVSHHQLIAVPQLFDKIVEGGEVVAVITVAHDNVLAVCG